MGCFSRAEKYFHPCLLVGRIINGKPIADFNRRIIALWIDTGSVEEGSLAAVKAGNGKVKVMENLGKVTVGVEQISLVNQWAEKAMRDSGRGASDELIFERIKEGIAGNISPDGAMEVVELDIFKGYVINRTKSVVFVFRRPSSFP